MDDWLERTATLTWGAFDLLRQLYSLRADAVIERGFGVSSTIFDEQLYLMLAGQRGMAVSRAALIELSECEILLPQSTRADRLRKTLYANHQERFLLQAWEDFDAFFAMPGIAQLGQLMGEALRPVVNRDVSIEALCAALDAAAELSESIQRRRVGTLLAALTPYVQHHPMAIGVALRFAGGFLADDLL